MIYFAWREKGIKEGVLCGGEENDSGGAAEASAEGGRRAWTAETGRRGGRRERERGGKEGRKEKRKREVFFPPLRCDFEKLPKAVSTDFKTPGPRG